MNLLGMIRRCIEQARQGRCTTCDRRETCVAARWQTAFAGGPVPPTPAPPLDGEAGFLTKVVTDLLGGVAEAFAPAVPRAAPGFRAEVQRSLEPLLASGEASAARVARALGVSRQTLYRRLRAEGATFEQVLEDVRRRLALRYLREGMSVKEAAWRLGFSDPAAFSRAFKRWTGRSPRTLQP